MNAHRYSFHVLAKRWKQLTDELVELDRLLTELVERTAPELIAVTGVGIETASTLLVAAGDNPERLHREQS